MDASSGQGCAGDPRGPCRVLVVDDFVENAEILGSFLEPRGYVVTAVASGEQALESILASPPDVILLDLGLPGISGFEVCRRLKSNPATCHIPVIIITGMTDRQANVEAIDAGADDFLLKPFDRVLLDARLRTSLKMKALYDELHAHQRELEHRVDERTRQVLVTQQVAVFSLAKLAESRDNETGDHLDRMRLYAHEIALELAGWPKYRAQITPDFLDQLYHSTPLHDIGKVGIPDRILLKPGKLSAGEFEIMKTHAAIGGDTLRAADLEAGRDSFLAMGRDIAYYHHERWDGAGYPFRLSGEQIPLPARIAAVADVYDALSSRRPYKEAFPHEKSRAIVVAGRGTHFDPDMVDAFLAREDRFLMIHARYREQDRPAPLMELVQRAEALGAAIA